MAVAAAAAWWLMEEEMRAVEAMADDKGEGGASNVGGIAEG